MHPRISCLGVLRSSPLGRKLVEIIYSTINNRYCFLIVLLQIPSNFLSLSGIIMLNFPCKLLQAVQKKMLSLLQVEKNYKKELDKNYIRESSMKNSVKILLLAGMLQVGYGKAMDLQDDNRVGNASGNQGQQQPAMSKQQVLDKVNDQLQLLQRQAAGVQDSQLAKQLVAQTLQNIAVLTGDQSLQDLYSVVDQAIDIADQDIKEQSSGQVVVQAVGDGPSFGQAFSIIATGIGSAVVTALGASVGAIGGGLGSAVVAVAAPFEIGARAYQAAIAPAPYESFIINSQDSIGTKAAKLLPNILSRTLRVVLTVSACTAIKAVQIVLNPVLMTGLGAGVAIFGENKTRDVYNRDIKPYHDTLQDTQDFLTRGEWDARNKSR
jgi:hypothetical protein